MAYEHPEEISSNHWSMFQTTSENGYDSDKIDSDIEDMLYSSIHHQTINSEELSFTPIKPNESLNNDDRNELLIPKIRNIFNERKVVKKKKIKELKILKRKNQDDEQQNDAQKLTVKQNKISSDQFDISYGHNITLNSNDYTDSKNGFYLEANYDNENIDEVMKKLPKDRRYWKVGQQDLQSSFFQRRGRHRPKQCNLCFQFGHLDRVCPNRIKKCFICGDEDHEQKSCDKKLICCKCFMIGHTSNNCASKIQCKLCHIVGHSQENCTFHWRKYLTVVNETDDHKDISIQSNDITINAKVSCYNCGMSGSHFGHECKSLTINRKRNEIPSPIFNLKRNKMGKKQQRKQQPISPVSEIKPFLLNVTNGSNGNVDSDDSLEYVENMLRQSNPSKNIIDQSNIRKKKRKSFKNVKNGQINAAKQSKNNSKNQPLNQQVVNGNTKKNKKKLNSKKSTNKKIKKNEFFDKIFSMKLQSNDGNVIKRKKLKTRKK
ncbi:uncharacterized protein LOC113792548 [Dermatophagoides pteronyssinus]|uniref:uncharacterized protein LOC113792548 n=1 Tax=Dermatophagoides pteronyssinus TaxID=6956 RepID=UPI003F66FF19